MIKIIKGALVYSPEKLGIKDILIIGQKIAAIEDNIDFYEFPGVKTEVINAEGKIVVPGFIDAHVHITGGGGEGGFKTRTPEIQLTDITTAGVTTVIGCLGTDGITRSMEALLAKARALEEEGISTFIYSGSYRVPLTTLTGDIMKDLLVVDKVIGLGEIAISDHRSSNPKYDEIAKLSADARVGAILSSKAGIINLHLGDSKETLRLIEEVINKTEIPYTQFLPTHMNRNPHLFEAGKAYAKCGGFIDFTTSSDPVFWEEGEVKASKALKNCLEEGVKIEHITFTSDGQGSLPLFNEKKECIGIRLGKVSTLFDEVKDAIIHEQVPIETALKTITSNPAKILKLNSKGNIIKGYDADLVILDEALKINSVIAKGTFMINNFNIKVYGTFEN